MPKYTKDWFGRQQRLADQEREAMRTILKIQDSDYGKPQAYDRRGQGDTKVAPMPGLYYDKGNVVDQLLDLLKIKPRKKRFARPSTPLDKRTGKSGFI